MPHYSIPVSKTQVCWFEIDHDGSLQDAIEICKEKLSKGLLSSVDLNEGFNEDELEYEPIEQHYCDEKEVKTKYQEEIETRFAMKKEGVSQRDLNFDGK